MPDQTKHFQISKEKTKAIPIVILLIVAVLGLTAVWFLSSSGRSDLDSLSSSLSFKGNKVTLQLGMNSNTYAVGDIGTVSVILNPYKKSISSTDVVLTYDPAIMRIVPNDEGKYIDTSGSAFSAFSKVSVNNETGVMSFSATLDPKGPSNGSGKVADIKFKTLKKGTAKIAFKFERGSDADTDVLTVDKRDVLEMVKNAEITIK